MNNIIKFPAKERIGFVSEGVSPDESYTWMALLGESTAKNTSVSTSLVSWKEEDEWKFWAIASVEKTDEYLAYYTHDSHTNTFWLELYIEWENIESVDLDEIEIQIASSWKPDIEKTICRGMASEK